MGVALPSLWMTMPGSCAPLAASRRRRLPAQSHYGDDGISGADHVEHLALVGRRRVEGERRLRHRATCHRRRGYGHHGGIKAPADLIGGLRESASVVAGAQGLVSLLPVT